ncbi:uncharacterized ENTR1 family protein-like [Achroia grisella]|uniref:uncharacterized ENTR1 family protein-like n=1 Tax=Achroia grisella TaxID=688607 RepID=UPI0027D26A03|nr:uncharacterized ENTR1 family protein-like [Achroia grisella]
MEVGAVKQDFNTEVILLKKKIVSGESKIKPKELAKFMITHTGSLNDYLNKPNVNQEKACARLLLHKSLQDKYKFIRDRFAGIPIKDLFMSRQERIKMKKEANDKNKKKKGNVVNSEGKWEVRDIELDTDFKQTVKTATSDEMVASDEEESGDEGESDDEEESGDVEESGDEDVASVDQSEVSNEENTSLNNYDMHDSPENTQKAINVVAKDRNIDNTVNETADVGKFVKFVPDKFENDAITCNNKRNNTDTDKGKNRKPSKSTEHVKKKVKDDNKNKNFNEKILLRKFKKDTDLVPVADTKVVDPFFITATGENYLSVAEPRQPDEVKEIHKQGNRKLRRAAMFGHVPKIKPRRDNFQNKSSYNNGDKFNSNLNNNFNNQSDNNESKTARFGYGKSNMNDNTNSRLSNKFSNSSDMKSDQNEDKKEKLHPSWEAKKRQSGILPYQGKKVVFDDG